MADGSSAPSARIGPVPAPRHGRSDKTVWIAPRALIKSQTWRRTSVTVFDRTPGEGYWRSDQYRINLSLDDFAQATVQVEGSKAQQINVAGRRNVNFCPPGLDGRVLHPGSTRWAQILQAPEIYRDLAAEIGSRVNVADFDVVLDLDDPQVALLAGAIVDEIRVNGVGGGALDHILVDTLNTALAVQIARRFAGPAMQPLPVGRLSRERLKRVLDYVEADLAGRLSLHELAGVACLSPYHFARCFKRSMGMGAHRYVMERRIERARRLIRETDLSLTDIAAAAGFDSQSSFTERFRREVGVSPGRLRRETA